MRLNLNFVRILIILSLGLLPASVSWAHARFTIAGVGNLFNPVSVPDQSATLTQSSPLTFGGGAWVDFMVHEHVDLEIGALYVPLRYRITSVLLPTVFSDVDSTALQFPVLVRFHLLPMLSVGVGGYYAMALGNLKSTDQAGQVTETDFAVAGYNKADYGLVASVGLHFPLGSAARLTIDGRYLMGLAEQVADSTLTGGTTSFKTKGIEGIVGIQFGGGMSK